MRLNSSALGWVSSKCLLLFGLCLHACHATTLMFPRVRLHQGLGSSKGCFSLLFTIGVSTNPNMFDMSCYKDVWLQGCLARAYGKISSCTISGITLIISWRSFFMVHIQCAHVQWEHDTSTRFHKINTKSERHVGYLQYDYHSPCIVHSQVAWRFSWPRICICIYTQMDSVILSYYAIHLGWGGVGLCMWLGICVCIYT